MVVTSSFQIHQDVSQCFTSFWYPFQRNKQLRENCPYSELFRFEFSSIWTEYGEIWSISPYSLQMRENADRNNSEYRHFLRSGNIVRKDFYKAIILLEKSKFLSLIYLTKLSIVWVFKLIGHFTLIEEIYTKRNFGGSGLSAYFLRLGGNVFTWWKKKLFFVRIYFRGYYQNSMFLRIYFCWWWNLKKFWGK